MKNVLMCLGVILALAACNPDGPSSAAEEDADQRTSELTYGTPANQADWPASLWVFSSQGSCTATAIGSRTILTAAHCVPDGGSLSTTVSGVSYSAVCTHHPEYWNNGSADWALCHTDRPMTNIVFERLSTTASHHAVNTTVLLTGYGCTETGGGNDGIYRIGNSTVSYPVEGTTYYFFTSGGAGVCPGDSGGAVFRVLPEGRYVVGVNSRYGSSGGGAHSATTVSTVINFFRNWASARGELICGLDAAAANCRPISGTSACPVSPSTLAPICPPFNRPAVFITPHPGQETIAMGGAIRQHVLAGRDVFIELMTRGEASGVRAMLSNGGTHTWHSGTHSYSLTVDQFANARRQEFLDAARRLGVKGVYLGTFPDGALTQANVATRVNWWIGNAPSGLSLKGTAGWQDPRTAGGTVHPDQAAVWNALTASGWTDVRGYLVNHYLTGAGTVSRVDSIATWCADKRNALGAYNVWNPASSRYSIGYHSSGPLIDKASSDCREFVAYP